MNRILVNGQERVLGLCPPTRPSNLPALSLPTSGPSSGIIDLRPLCPPVKNQLSLGACASFAACTFFFEFFYSRLGMPIVKASELAFYYWVRLVAGLPTDQDTGSSIADTVNAARIMGFPPDVLEPYDVGKFTTAPSDQVVAAAAVHKMEFGFNTPTVETIDASLEHGFPVVIGMQLTRNFQMKVGPDGIYIPGGPYIGGHGMGIVGKDDTMKAGGYHGFYWMQNQWDVDYGNAGYVAVPKALAADGTIGEGTTVRRTQVQP